MNIFLYILLPVAVYVTVRNYRNWIHNEVTISFRQLFSFKVAAEVSLMLALAVAIYYAKEPLDVYTYLAVIAGFLIGLLNVLISSAVKREKS